MKIAQSHPTFWDPLDYTVHSILQARILELVAFLFSRRSSQPRDRTQVSLIAGGFFSSLATGEAQEPLEWVAYPFSSGSSWPRNQTEISCIAGRFFTNWAIRKARGLQKAFLIISFDALHDQPVRQAPCHRWRNKGSKPCLRLFQFSSVQSFSHVQLLVTPWTTARQASLPITNSRSPPKPMFIESVMPSNHLILCRPLLLLPSIFPCIRVF